MFFRDSLMAKLLLALLVFCFGLFVWLHFLISDTPLSYFKDYWQISLTMMFGSFIAGATSEGGGAIAFPVFTKILDISAFDAKVFSLAIQSVGMGAASVLIIVCKTRVEWRAIVWASIGGGLGMVLYVQLLVDVISSEMIRMLFTAMLAGFALTLLLLNHRSDARHQCFIHFTGLEKALLVFFGFIGGVISGLIGNGIDVIIFSLLVLLFRIDEKVATPTSVILMAINAITGFILHVLVLESFTPTIQNYWLAAIPVVLVGAPLGAVACSLLSRKTIVYALLFLILMEVGSSLVLISFTFELVLFSLMSFVGFLMLYCLMYQSNQYTQPDIAERLVD